MAPSIRPPFRARLFTFDVIVWICFLCAAACQSQSTNPSKAAGRTNDGNSIVDAEIRLMPTIVKSNLAIRSNNQKHGPDCHGRDCNSSRTAKVLGHAFEEVQTATKKDLNDLLTTKGSSKQDDSTTNSSNELPRDQGFLPDGPHRKARSALNKNFLRFGRNGLNRNFLRFGRTSLKQNFLRFGRSDLPKNFLRFGRNDVSGDSSTDGSYQASNNKADFPSMISTNKKLMEAIQNYDSTAKDDQHDTGYEPCDRSTAIPEANSRSCHTSDDVDTSSMKDDSNYDNYGEIEKKTGSLNKRYLDVRRRYYTKLYGGKRGSLDRNFLRFGKRWSSSPSHYKTDVSYEDDGEDGNGVGGKVKRQIDHLTSFNEDHKDDPHQQSKKSVLLLANPWLSKNEKSHNTVNDQQSTHEELIRRRSLDKNVWSDLQSNFIRFGKR